MEVFLEVGLLQVGSIGNEGRKEAGASVVEFGVLEEFSVSLGLDFL